MESKGLRVNMKKTKFLISGVGLNLLHDSGEFPCAICRSGHWCGRKLYCVQPMQAMGPQEV